MFFVLLFFRSSCKFKIILKREVFFKVHVSQHPGLDRDYRNLGKGRPQTQMGGRTGSGQDRVELWVPVNTFVSHNSPPPISSLPSSFLQLTDPLPHGCHRKSSPRLHFPGCTAREGHVVKLSHGKNDRKVCYFQDSLQRKLASVASSPFSMAGAWV